MSTTEVHPEVASVAADIPSMETRGAATIARAVTDALGTQAAESRAADPAAFDREMWTVARHLLGTRPTAVSLPNALRYVDAIATERGQFPPESIVTLMRELFGEGPNRPWEEP